MIDRKAVRLNQFLNGGGEMGELIRLKDWSRTPLGDPDTWPQSLRTAVNILLHSRFPMFIWWGWEMVMVYNDAYKVIAGSKHPKALGSSGPEIWPEIWDEIGPLAEKVMTKGISTWSEDQLLYINRQGHTEETYFTFSYSPIQTESGEVGGVFCTCTETTAKVISARKLGESEKNLRNLVMQAPVGICIVKGEAPKVEVINDTFLELIGKRRKECEENPYWEVLREAEATYAPILADVVKSGISYYGKEHEVILIRNGKEETVFVDFVFEPIRETDGMINRIMIVAIDVSEKVISRRKIEEVVAERTMDLKEANKLLQYSNSELEQFAYIASHDLQEPLRKVSTYTGLLKQRLGAIDELSGKYLGKIVSASSRMLNLIRDVLTFSQLSQQNLSYEPVDLTDIIEQVIMDFEIIIGQTGALIHYAGMPSIEAIPLQMAQLFSNLISNSLKFSRAGINPVISISSRLLTKEEKEHHLITNDGHYYLIRLSDNGIGFNQENAEQIFNIFQRLHRVTDYSGTGIGLAMCKKVAENHQGKIYATAEKNSCAIFNIILPAKHVNKFYPAQSVQ